MKLVSYVKNTLVLKSKLHCNTYKYGGVIQSCVYTGENNIKYIFEFWKNNFVKYKIPEPIESIENIITFNLGSSKISDVYKNFDLKLNIDQMEEIQKMCELRLNRMPIQYIIKEWDFRDMTLKMRPPVFIPRPETEMLIDIILDDLKGYKKINILEICCGSGAISLALLKSLPESFVTAVDKSIEACELTKENADIHNLQHRLKVIKTEVNNNNTLQKLSDDFDIIVSNPPYVPSNDMEKLEPEITMYEDLQALDGGPDGLKLIKLILLIAADKLKLGGKLYLETDILHPPIIEQWIKHESNLRLNYLQTYKDFCKKDRFVKLIKI